MIGERIELWHKEEYHYPAAHGFIPIMVSYIHEDELMHPAMLVVPGGGYRLVSPSGNGLGSLAFFRLSSSRLVMTAPPKSKRCSLPSGDFSSVRIRVSPFESVTLALFHHASWGKSARVVSTNVSALTGRPNSSVKHASGSRLMPQLW